MAYWLRTDSYLPRWTTLAIEHDHDPNHHPRDIKAIAAALPPKRNKRPKRRRTKHGRPLDPSLLTQDPRIEARTIIGHDMSSNRNKSIHRLAKNELELLLTDKGTADPAALSKVVTRFFGWSRPGRHEYGPQSVRVRDCLKQTRARHEERSPVPKPDSDEGLQIGTATKESNAPTNVARTSDVHKYLNFEAVAVAAAESAKLDHVEPTSKTHDTENEDRSAMSAPGILFLPKKDEHDLTAELKGSAALPAAFSMDATNNSTATKLRKAVLKRLVSRARFAAKRARIIEEAVQSLEKRSNAVLTPHGLGCTAEPGTTAALDYDGGWKTWWSNFDEDVFLVVSMVLVFLYVALAASW